MNFRGNSPVFKTIEEMEAFPEGRSTLVETLQNRGETPIFMRNIREATKAAQIATTALSIGACNVPNAKASDEDIHVMREKYQKRAKKMSDFGDLNTSKLFDLRAEIAEECQVGNCFEYSVIAFRYLKKTVGRQDVGIVSLKHGDHCFVVVGQGKSAVACDPWARRIFPLVETKHHLEEICRSNNIKLSGDLSLKPLLLEKTTEAYSESQKTLPPLKGFLRKRRLEDISTS